MSRYDLGQQLGRGAYGVVYKARDTLTGRTVAAKVVDLASQQDLEDVQRELKMLQSCQHSNITQYYGMEHTGHRLILAMEYMAAGSCLDLLTAGPFAEKAIAAIMGSCLKALVYLHSQGRIHRDIKAANILVSANGEVKLADFGVSTQLSNNMSKRITFVGTPYWMAPEIIRHDEYSFMADIWSLGITAMELAFGRPPLSQYHPFDVLPMILDDEPPTLGGNYSDEFNDFVSKCLQKDPKDRSDAESLLEHTFIKMGKSSNAGNIEIKRLIGKKLEWDKEMNMGPDKKRHPITPPSSESDTLKTLKPQLLPQTPKTPRHQVSHLSRFQLPEYLDSPKKGTFNESTVEQMFKDILHSSFNKVSSNCSLSGTQSDQLNKFQDALLDSFFNDDKSQADINSRYFKVVMKKVMNAQGEDGAALRSMMLPKWYIGMAKEMVRLQLNNDNKK